MVKENIALNVRRRQYALVFFCFFLVVTLISVSVVFPQFNRTLQAQSINDSKVTLQTEAEILQRYIGNLRSNLEDLASYPALTGAVLLSRSDNSNFTNLVDNHLTNGKRSTLVVQNISGEILYQSDESLMCTYSPEHPRYKSIIENGSSGYLQLHSQSGDKINLILSVPVKYRGHTEGMISSEITVPIKSMFSGQAVDKGSAFEIRQGETIAETPLNQIEMPRRISQHLEDVNLTLTYIYDEQKLILAKNEFRNMFIAALFVGLVLSFILLTIFSFESFDSVLEEVSESTGRPIRIYIVPVVIAVIGVAASISGFLLLQESGQQRSLSKTLATNQAKISAIESDIESGLKTLSALKVVFENSDIVTRESFSTYAGALLPNHRSIRAFVWAPAVPKAQRNAFEQLAAYEGLQNFRFIEHNDKGEIIGAEPRYMHFPIYYAEPVSGNEKAIGFDLASHRQVMPTLRLASDSGAQVATGSVDFLYGSNAGQTGVLVADPIFVGRELKGFILAVLQLDNLTQGAIQHFRESSLVHIDDITDPSAPVSLFTSTGKITDLQNGALSESKFDVAGRVWRIRVSPSDSVLFSPPKFVPLSILVAGSLGSLFMAYMIFHIIHRKNAIEKIVEKRTRQITLAHEFQDLIMKHVPDLLFVKDQDFRIINANQEFLNLYPEDQRGEILGTTTIESYEPEEAEEFLYYDRLALDTGQSEVEETILFPDGKQRTLLTKKVRFENDNGKPFILGIAREITAIKQAEKEREALRTAMEYTVEGVAQLDTQGFYTYVNDAYAKMCGYQAEALIGRHWHVTVHRDDIDMMNDAYEYMLTTGKATGEPRGIRGDGSTFYKSITMISKLDENGLLTGHHCFMSDITQRKQHEEEILRSNQELDDFAYIASHDLKEPLRGMRNHANLLAEQYQDSLDDEAKHKITRITVLSERMESLIKDLLHYSRLGRGFEPVAETNLNDVVNDVQELMGDSSDVTIEIVNELPSVKCDKSQISVLFRNLISNAIKYNESDNKVVQLGCRQTDKTHLTGEILFFVKDNGIGIDERFYGDIFKIFRRLHKRDAFGGGTGSGLTFVRKIVIQHGGDIWLKSTPGEGTTFFFTLATKEIDVLPGHEPLKSAS